MSRRMSLVMVSVSWMTMVVACGCGSPSAPPTAGPASGGAAPVGHGHGDVHEHGHAHDDHGHDHDHGDHDEHGSAKTLGEVFHGLKKAMATVASMLASDSHDAADDAVHEVGHLLEDMETLVAKQATTADVKAACQQAVTELVECFDRIDQSLHAPKDKGEAPSAVHASVAARIEAAVASLEEQIGRTQASKEEK